MVHIIIFLITIVVIIINRDIGYINYQFIKKIKQDKE